MLSTSCKKKISQLRNGEVVSTVFYKDVKDMKFTFPNRPMLMVAQEEDLKFDEFMKVVWFHRPLFVVPPFNRHRVDYTSMAAERTRAMMPGEWDVDVGTVIPKGRDENQVEFLAWAAQNAYAPIVIPPDQRKPRAWQMNQFHQHRVLMKGMWYHMTGDVPGVLTYADLPGVHTWGVGVE